MKKSLIIAVSILLASFIGVVIIIASITAAEGKETYSEVYGRGDKSVLENLNVVTHKQVENNVKTDSTAHFTKDNVESEVLTTYTYNSEPNYKPLNEIKPKTELRFISGLNKSDEGELYERLQSDSISSDELKKELGYYPRKVVFNYGLYEESDNDNKSLGYTSNSAEPSEKYKEEFVNLIKESFKIPFVPDEELSVKKTEYDDILPYIETSKFSWDITGVKVGNSYYFAFDNEYEVGKYVDTSELSKGYGVYRIYVGESSYALNFEMELPGEVSVRAITKSVDEKDLYIVTREDGCLYLYIFNLENNLAHKSLIADDSDRKEIVDYNNTFIEAGENFVALRIDNEIYAVELESGEYKVIVNYKGDAADAKNSDEGLITWDSDNNAGLKWIVKDDKLYVVQVSQSVQFSDGNEVPGGISVQVFGGSKELYRGRFTSTMEKDNILAKSVMVDDPGFDLCDTVEVYFK